MTLPVLAGVGAYQLNMLFNSTMIARYETGLVTILTFVQNITIQLVLAFVYSVTSVIYPRLSESAAKGNMEEYKDTLGGILKTVSALLIPISFGFISVRQPLLNFLVAWGKVTGDAVDKAEIFLCLYSLGIIGIGLKEILDRAFYSVKNTKISAVNGFIIMLANVLLSLIFMPFFRAYGIPLAYSVSSIIGLLNLLWQLKRKIGAFAKGMGKDIIKSIIASLIMMIIVYFTNEFLGSALGSETFVIRFIKLITPAALGVCVYLISGYILKIEVIETYAKKLFK